jgi:catechol 2,3-dioxygenase-like lactoylglutathione lyase family enzyme
MIIGIDHVQITIPMNAVAEARAFYCGLLGLREVQKPASLQERGGFWLQVGDRQVHVGTEEGVARHTTKAHVAYATTDLPKWRAQLTAAGVEVHDGIPIAGRDRFEFRDPFGNRVEFIMASVSTGTVRRRRHVRLRTLEDLETEADRVTAAAAAGMVRPLGNWSPAQVLWHIGRLMELSFDGFPFRYRRGPEWITRLFRLLAWRWLIALAFRPGFKNPPEAATLEPERSLTLDVAAAYLKQQIARVHRGERMTQECSVDGPYSHEQWIYIHLRHAELHLSFLAIEAA